jgi:hypothetical protein
VSVQPPIEFAGLVTRVPIGTRLLDHRVWAFVERATAMVASRRTIDWPPDPPPNSKVDSE